MALYKIKRSKISKIFISHLHGDHYFGLIGLLTSLGLLGRTADLHIYAPPLLESIIHLQLDAASAKLPYPVYFHAITEEGEIANDKLVTVHAFKTSHRIECWGFLFKEIKHPRSLQADRLQSYGVEISSYESLMKGQDLVMKNGTIIPNEELTKAAAAPRQYAYCADTMFDESIAQKIKGAQTVYHESTYLAELAVTARERFHSTTVDAANIARLAGAEQLLLGHFSSKYQELDVFLTEAGAIFPNTFLAIEGKTFTI